MINKRNVFSSSPDLDKVSKVSLEDIDIIKAVLTGQTDSYRYLVEKYMNSVMAIVSRRIPTFEAKDVVHDVFVRAYNSLKKYRADSPFEHWLAKIAVRECYDYWRKKYKNKIESISENEQSVLNFNESENKNQALELINYALSKLNPENRAVIILVHLEGYSVAEAAEMLGWSVANVKVRAHRAREQLREILKDEEQI